MLMLCFLIVNDEIAQEFILQQNDLNLSFLLLNPNLRVLFSE